MKINDFKSIRAETFKVSNMPATPGLEKSLGEEEMREASLENRVTLEFLEKQVEKAQTAEPKEEPDNFYRPVNEIISEFMAEPTKGEPPIRAVVMKDGGLDLLAGLIDAAEKSIDLKMYIITGGEEKTMNALTRALDRNVKVRLMVEEKPFYWEPDSQQENPSQKAIDALKKKGAEVKWTNPRYSGNRVTHEKSLILDGKRGVIMTGNLGKSANTNLDIGAVLIKDKDSNNDLQAVFDYDWNRTNDKDLLEIIADTKLVVSPDNSWDKLTKLVDSAKKSMMILNQAFSDNDMMKKIIAKKVEGVDVKVVIGDGLTNDGNIYPAGHMKAHGIKVGFMEKPYLHAKAMTIDSLDNDPSDDKSFIGSQNFSTSAFKRNREMGIIFDDPDGQIRDIIKKYGTCVEEVPDKQASTNARTTGDIIKKTIYNAERSIILQARLLTDTAVAKNLVSAKKRGVDVKVILPDKGFLGELNKPAIDILKEGKVSLKLIGDGENIRGGKLGGGRPGSSCFCRRYI